MPAEVMIASAASRIGLAGEPPFTSANVEECR